MYRYLSSKTADYTTTTLYVNPTTILPQTGDKTQYVYELDDGSVSVVGVSTNTFFNIELQWDYITNDEHTTLMDFWYSETKGAGRRRTFYWFHPIDEKIYTVRFTSNITSSYHNSGYLSVNPITIHVEGNKP